MTDHGLDLAVIGNGRTAALVDPTARLVWWCYPRFDRDPMARVRYPKRESVPVLDVFTAEEEARLIAAQTRIRDRVGVVPGPGGWKVTS